MRLKQYINEKRKNNVIVVDVQPMYRSNIRFNMDEFVGFLNQQGKILYLFNGPDTVGGDSKEDINEWLWHHDLMDSNKIKWVDKGYGFFRSWMDSGVDVSLIKKALRIMLRKKVHDSRDIDNDTWKEELPELWKFAQRKYGNVKTFFDDNIYLPPDIRIDKLKKWSGSYIVGGGRSECLQEMLILLSVFNIKVKVVKGFTY